MKQKRKVATVRQFLYLDTEQIRSFVAQIEQGLPEEGKSIITTVDWGRKRGDKDTCYS